MEIGKPKYDNYETGTIPFGKHKGEKLTDIEVEYLEWVQKQDWVEEKYPILLTDIEHELLRREAESDELAQFSEENDELLAEYEYAFANDVFDPDRD